MSLSRVSLGQIVWKQYRYKIQSYTDALKSLLIIQLIAIFFSVMGTGGGGTSDGFTNISVDFYSSDIVFVFTLLWMFITSILLTTRAYRYEDFSFVTNRLSSQLANLLYLTTGAVVGLITVVLSSFLIYVIVLLFKSEHILLSIQSQLTLSEMALAAGGAFLYLLLVSSLGYLAGALTQLNRLLVVALPALVIVLPIIFAQSPLLNGFYNFYFQEFSLFVFAVKVGLTGFTLFAAAIWLLNKREVRE